VTAPPLAAALADWAARLTFTDLPPAAASKARLRVLDTVGLILAGGATEAGTAIRAQVLATAGTGQATLLGSASRLPAAQAALAHGVMSHCRDFDDTFVDSVVHPGSVIVPTALAVAEAADASAEEFVTAMVAGYEVAARIGAVAGRRFHAHQLHATGIVGPIAAAVTAGRLLRLDGGQIAWAMGLAASMSGGLMAFIVDGGWSKWLHAGWAAHGGIVAAELASRGFRGPRHVLDGGHDLYTALLHGEAIDRSAVLDALGSHWAGEACAFKYYPCAHVIQPYIDVVLGLCREHRLRAGDIESITCTIAPWAAAIVAEPREAKLRFDSELEAIASLPYQLAVAVIEGHVGLEALTAESRQRADYAAFARNVVHRSDPALHKGFDGAVELVTRSGSTHRRTAQAAGADAGKLLSKFKQLATVRLGAAGAHTTGAELAATDGWKAAVRVLRG